MTRVTLVVGGDSTRREMAIAARAVPGQRITALVEGLPSTVVLQGGPAAPPAMQVIRIAPGCPCCSGNLSLRVTLNRALRDNPDQLYLSLANREHLAGVINFLQEDQYQSRLEISQTLDCSALGTGFAPRGY
jgi:hypothetical protein